MTRAVNEDLAIVFDLGGVLIDWNPRYLYRKMFNGDEQEMAYFLSAVCPMDWNETMDAGKPFAQAVQERIDLFPQYEPYIRAYHGRWVEMVGGEIEETIPVLARVKERGYPLFALSNWSAETFALVKNRFQFLDWFDEVVISGEVGAAKPDRKIFDVFLQRVGRPANHCLFIDDNKRNIEAAQMLGFQTIHFTGAQKLHAQLLSSNLID